MNLIILAAGQGRRLYPLTKDQPKTLLDVGDGTTLLSSQLDAAIESTCINKVYVVGGFLSEQIEEATLHFEKRIPVEVIFNPYFDLTNALFSLWTAHYVLREDDFMISNGDNYYRNEFFDQVEHTLDAGIAATVSVKPRYADDDMKIRFDSNGKFGYIGKDVLQEDAGATSVGLLTVKGADARKLFHSALIAMVKIKSNRNALWQNILNYLTETGSDIRTTEIPAAWWAEVDFHPDAEVLRQALMDSLN